MIAVDTTSPSRATAVAPREALKITTAAAHGAAIAAATRTAAGSLELALKL